jgi:hypothetical protein
VMELLSLNQAVRIAQDRLAGSTRYASMPEFAWWKRAVAATLLLGRRREELHH